MAYDAPRTNQHSKSGPLFAALEEFPRDFVLERRQHQAPRADLDKLFGKTTD
jgi:hypothetical protein